MKSRAQMYDELLRQSKALRDENILAHKARTARIKKGKSWQARLNPRAAAAKMPLDFLAIGDSWFEYPLYDNGPVFEETLAALKCNDIPARQAAQKKARSHAFSLVRLFPQRRSSKSWTTASKMSMTPQRYSKSYGIA